MKSKYLKSVFSFKALVVILLVGFQMHNYLMNMKLREELDEMKGLTNMAVEKSKDTWNFSALAADFAEKASNYALEAAENAEDAYNEILNLQ